MVSPQGGEMESEVCFPLLESAPPASPARNEEPQSENLGDHERGERGFAQ